MLVDKVIQRDADDGRRNDANENLRPDRPGVFLFCRIFSSGKRVQAREEIEHNGEDCGKLDDVEEHRIEFGGHCFEGKEALNEDHMTRGADRQPFGNSLHDADEDDL